MSAAFLRAWLFGTLLVATVGVQAQTQVLDNFAEAGVWRADASDQVKAALRMESKGGEQALCLDYDFNGVSGYAVARRKLPLVFPQDYRFELNLHGQGGPNHLEMKWVDASGENVWWATRRNWQPSALGEAWRIKKRHIEFAWGPTADKQLHTSSSLELVVSSGSAGGRGSVCMGQLRWSTLAVDAPAQAQPIVLHAQSAESGFAGQWLVDLGRVREFGSASLNWASGRAARQYELETSEDGLRWDSRWHPKRASGDNHDWFLPESEARYLRVRMHDGSTAEHPLLGVQVGEVGAGATRNAFVQALAQKMPPGSLPRAFSGQQSYWTLLGAESGGASGLLGEDGAIELGRGGASVEPFLWLDSGERVSWAQAQISHSLQEGYLPMPSVTWQRGDLALDVTAAAMAEGTQTQIIGRYTVRNLGRTAQRVRLVLALRPWQVNPPTQFLNTPGGTSPLHRVAWDGRVLQTDTPAQVWPLSAPDEVLLWPGEAGLAVPGSGALAATGAQSLTDEQGMAQGALLYTWVVPPGGSRRLDVVLPLGGAAARLPANMGAAKAWADQQFDSAAERWRALLNPMKWRVPPQAQPLVDSLRTALAHMLMSRDGAALQPGTRSYARSWIRDGAMMVEGLLRVGHDRVAQDFVQWYAPYQFASGKVPCCVDRRGADPVPENDSHGQFIFAVAQLHRYTRNTAQLRALWPQVERAALYMEGLRQSERSTQNLMGERRAFWGLLPASISHEGYSAKPMHSYWDDFWALRGYKDAIYVAEQLGQTERQAQWGLALAEFERDLQHSLSLTASRHGLDYMAGSAELGDFDATSTTVALSPAQASNDAQLLNATFERYWREFVRRRDTDHSWEDYTPYELRTVGSMVRLGWTARAHEALKFFMADQRPAGWNQWAEVVGRDARKPRFLGDMPHAWISSDYVRSVLDLFAYERESDGALVLAPGFPADWFRAGGVGLTGLATSFGRISYSVQLTAWGLNITTQSARAPPGGWRFRWPGPSRPPLQARVNGRSVQWEGGELKF